MGLLSDSADDEPDLPPARERDDDLRELAEDFEDVREELREARDERDELVEKYHEQFGSHWGFIEAGETAIPPATERREPEPPEERAERIREREPPEPPARVQLENELAEAEGRVRRLREAKDLLEKAVRRRRKRVSTAAMPGDVDDAFRGLLGDVIEKLKAARDELARVPEFRERVEDLGYISSFFQIPAGAGPEQLDGLIERLEGRRDETLPPAPEDH